MAQIVLHKTIRAPEERIWQILDDVGGIATWNNGVASSRITNDISSGEGAKRYCAFDAKGKNYAQEEVTYRKGNEMRINIFDTNAPVKSMGATIVTAATPTGTMVTFNMHFGAKGGPLAPVFEGLLFKPNLKKAVRGLLEDLEREATGKRI